jgi:sugar phosphate permease
MRYLVLALVCVAAVIAYVQRTALTVPTKTIQEDLAISEGGMGLVFGCWYWAYALLQVPAGWLTDRVGSKRALVVLVFAWSALTGLAALTAGFAGLLVIWSLMAAAQTGLVPGAAKAIGGWLPPTGRAFGAGMVGASMALGGAVAPFIAAWLLTWFTWRQMLGLYVLPGLIWVYAVTAIVPARSGPAPSLDPLGETLRRIATSPTMYLLCAQHFFRAAAMALFFTWFPRFLQETRGVTQFESGMLAMWPGVGAVAGGILGGLASDAILSWTGNRRLSRQGIAVLGMVCCALLAGAAYFVRDVNVAVLLISLGAFWGTFGGVSGYSVCIDFGGRRVGMVISVMNMCGNVGAGLFAFLVGWLVTTDEPATHNPNWDLVLPLFAIIFAIDAVCWALLNPIRPLFEDADGPS